MHHNGVLGPGKNEVQDGVGDGDMFTLNGKNIHNLDDEIKKN